MKNHLLILLLVIELMGCTTFTKPIATDPRVINPSSKPVQNITDFSGALACVDRLIEDTESGDVILMIDRIPNESGERLASSAKTMLMTAIQKIGARSRKIKFVVMGGAAEKVAEMARERDKEKHDLTFQYPDYFITGAITQAERGVAKQGQGFGLKVEKVAGIDYGKHKTMSAIGLDLQMGNIKNMQLLPNVVSSNLLAVYESGTEFSAGIAVIKKTDLDYSMEYSHEEGMSAAIRNLIELGTIEVFGKLLNLHYEQCLTPRTRRIILRHGHARTPQPTFGLPAASQSYGRKANHPATPIVNQTEHVVAKTTTTTARKKVKVSKHHHSPTAERKKKPTRRARRHIKTKIAVSRDDTINSVRNNYDQGFD